MLCGSSACMRAWLRGCAQALLAIPLIGLYMGGAFVVKAIEGRRGSLAR